MRFEALTRRVICLLGVVVFVSVLGGCEDRQPLGPAAGSPDLVESPTVLTGWGTAVIDGVVNAAEWSGAAVFGPVEARLPGGKRAQVTLRVMNDAENLYLAVEYNRRVTDPDNVVRLALVQGEVTDIARFSGSAGPEDLFLLDGVPTFDVAAGGSSDVEGARRTAGGRTVYELSKKRFSADAGTFDVTMSDGEGLAFTIQLITAGNVGITTVTGVLASASMNDPALPDAHVTVVGPYCEVTVTARRTDHDAGAPGYAADFFRLSRAVPNGGDCLATFADLPVGSRWVFSAHNTIISAESQFDVWPNAFAVPVPTDGSLPNQQGAVYVELPAPGGSQPLTSGNYYDALDGAVAFTQGEQRALTLHLTPGRSVACTAGPGSLALIHAMVALDPARVPAEPQSGLPPALGLYVDRASTTGCTLLGLPGEHVVVEAIDANGTTYRGLVGPNDGTVTLDPDPDLQKAHYVLDSWDDAQPLDIGLIVFGLATAPQGATDELIIKADVRGLDANGTSTWEFELELGGVALLSVSEQLRVTMSCNRGASGQCRIVQVQPDGQTARILTPLFTAIDSGDASVDPDTGNGFITLRLDVSDLDTVGFRLRSTRVTGPDFAPDQDPDPTFARWTRSPGEGNSFTVSF
jgi:hypothetical protein